jgi:hypothetical protein
MDQAITNLWIQMEAGAHGVGETIRAGSTLDISELLQFLRSWHADGDRYATTGLEMLYLAESVGNHFAYLVQTKTFALVARQASMCVYAQRELDAPTRRRLERFHEDGKTLGTEIATDVTVGRLAELAADAMGVHLSGVPIGTIVVGIGTMTAFAKGTQSRPWHKRPRCSATPPFRVEKRASAISRPGQAVHRDGRPI